jgi:hypothetical protein
VHLIAHLLLQKLQTALLVKLLRSKLRLMTTENPACGGVFCILGVGHEKGEFRLTAIVFIPTPHASHPMPF